MEDLQIYIYIVLAIIYFIFQALRKKKPEGPAGDYDHSTEYDEDSPSVPERDKTMTFEELLEEFTSKKTEGRARKEIVEEEPAGAEVLQEDDDEAESYDTYDDYKSSPYGEYSEKIKEGKSLKTLDELVEIEEPLEKRFDEYKVKVSDTSRADKYRKILNDPEGIKDAILLREILDTKYF